MVEVINKYAQCDECGANLSYDKEDLELAWNAFHTRRLWYLHCPVCDNDIPVKEYDDLKSI